MRMIHLATLVALVCVAAESVSQVSQRGNGWSRQAGVQIQGNTDINAKQDNANATAVGEGNSAKNTAGAIKSGTLIQGNTKISAKQSNANAIAAGSNNNAGNEVGVIGDSG